MKNINLKDLKKTIGENTEKLEKKVKDLWNQSSPHYSNLEPWKRGLILIGLTLGTGLLIYWLVSENEERKEKRRTKWETKEEERLLKRMELFKKLRD